MFRAVEAAEGACLNADASQSKTDLVDLRSLGIGLLASHRQAASAAEQLLRKRYLFAEAEQAKTFVALGGDGFMMMPAFHRKRVKGQRQYWSVEDWRILLLGLVENLLKPGGAIFILMTLDKDDQGNVGYSPLIEWARERGARLGRTKEDGPIRHILFDPATTGTFAKTSPQRESSPV